MTKNIGTLQTLNNGVDMPCFGLGVFRAQPGDEVYNAVRWALDYGYRLVDTAAMYENEQDVGRAIRESGLPRESVFVTTKLWINDFDDVEAALDKSLKALGMDYVDLYLQHWPGTDAGRRHKVWDDMLEQAAKGKIRACGVSNYMQDQLEQLIDQTGVAPTNNQIEIHPWHQQSALREYCANMRISVTSWGPIFHGHLSEVPLMAELGEKYGKTAAQVTLRWHVQQNINLIPKSVNKDRILENAQIFDFELSTEDMQKIEALDGRVSFAFDPHIFNGDVEEARAERDDRLRKANIKM